MEFIAGASFIYLFIPLVASECKLSLQVLIHHLDVCWICGAATVPIFSERGGGKKKTKKEVEKSQALRGENFFFSDNAAAFPPGVSMHSFTFNGAEPEQTKIEGTPPPIFFLLLLLLVLLRTCFCFLERSGEPGRGAQETDGRFFRSVRSQKQKQKLRRGGQEKGVKGRGGGVGGELNMGLV